ncbi:neuroepithelial cell-transforming gene 1 protein-like [Carassius auratus]|uniref:Neuroepithelial cell-transforming gene 1 protein-like n=1 Tax=Carassius auratus TaxID=7957 RepID=A0A6P6NFE9_CARAU|nr:neuroepithelial cell-transforming gene 1 protein-like [Carassius auratus]
MEETDGSSVTLPVAQPVNERPRRNKRKSSVADLDASPEHNFKRPSLRRGSSFVFLTPGPQWDFTLKRKRREKDDADAVSLCSFDFKFHSLYL